MPRPRVTGLALFVFIVAALTLLAPFRAEFPASRVGGLLAIAAGVEMLHALRRATAASRRQAMTGAVISMVIALFLINAPFVTGHALRLIIAAWFLLDAMRYALGARRKTGTDRTLALLAALGNAGVVLLLIFARGWIVDWTVAIAGALRIAGIAWNIMTAPVYSAGSADETVVAELGLADQPEAVKMAAEIEAAVLARTTADRGWMWAFVATLFAIHVGRMQVNYSFVGFISPGVAVFGDMVVAVIVSLLVISPLYLVWRAPTRIVERRVWRFYLQPANGVVWRSLRRIAGGWLHWRMTMAIRMRGTRYSIPVALERSLQTGLPIAAIIAATVPVWGMSWYFDTENWAAGIWNSWAESRTDSWRESMVRAVIRTEGGQPTPGMFAVVPPNIDSGDFSFIVIGDTGEGDASQHVLRDQLLAVSSHPETRFVVVSSDVIYPSGEMKDYEPKFWLPFKGIAQPVYAIPGNHDWYDGLEGFSVTFMTPDAARASIRARVEADLRMTSTTGARIDRLIAQAARLRDAYRVPTGFQHAPFFEIQTDSFALVAIDTGVLKKIDRAQQAWLEAALQRAQGKTIMAIVGHPFYAGASDMTIDHEDFARLKEMLVRAGATILMGGDTHDLEYYSDSGTTPASTVHNFVNGGGGAYLSFGAALGWPDNPPTSQWAHYPNRADVMAKIEEQTPWWKRPAWWWTKHFNAWPFSAEWLSAAFDYNTAPFFQSFFEVRVERSARRIRLIPYGVHGPLTWGEIATSAALRPAGATDRTPAEWIVPMR